MQLEKPSRNRTRILEILIPFFGVLAPYKIASIPLPAFLLLIIVFVQLLHTGGTLHLSRRLIPFVIFWGYTVLRDIFHMLFSVSVPVSSQLNRLIENTVLYLLIFVTCSHGVDENALFRWWKIAGVIFGLGMLYHVFQLLVLDQNIRPISIIPGYDISHDAGMDYDRPCSFFSEPASYIQSMMPLLFLSLKRKDFLWSALATFLIVVSTSTVGVLLCAVLWVAFIMLEKKSAKVTFLFLCFITIFVFLFLNLSIFSASLEKAQEVSSGESTWGSRVEGPFQIIGAMPWSDRILGSPILDTTEFVRLNIGKFPRDSSPYRYLLENRTMFLNTICLLIYRYGFVGLGLFLYTFMGKLSQKSECRLYAIMLLVAIWGQGSIATPGIPLIVMLLFATKQKAPTHTIIGPKETTT